MINLEIKRTVSTKNGTFGVLSIKDKEPFALTLEREWLDNLPNVSCIPSGEYICKRVNSFHFGNTFEVTDVEGRSHILFHKGNINDDSHGCILIGEQFGVLGCKPAILSSKQGFEEFLKITENVDSFNLSIHNLFF